MKIACGYNPAFLYGLQITKTVDMIEHGYSSEILNYQIPIERLLHINRSPITECNESQDQWFKQLENLHIDFSKFISVGFHLIGNRSSNIGQFDLSSHYIPSSKSEKEAIRFITKLKESHNINIWLENANFYSNDKLSIIKSVESMNYISSVTHSYIILEYKSSNYKLP